MKRENLLDALTAAISAELHQNLHNAKLQDENELFTATLDGDIPLVVLVNERPNKHFECDRYSFCELFIERRAKKSNARYIAVVNATHNKCRLIDIAKMSDYAPLTTYDEVGYKIITLNVK